MFEQKAPVAGVKTTAHYNLVVKGLMNHFLPPKLIQHQKRYLHQGLFNSCDSKIQGFIFCVYEIVDYLKNLPLFGMNQGLPYDKIIRIFEFTLYC